MDTPRVHPHEHDDDTVEAHYASLERPLALRSSSLRVRKDATNRPLRPAYLPLCVPDITARFPRTRCVLRGWMS